MKSILTRICLVGFFFGIGFSAILATSPKFIISRDPAAIRQVYDFSHLRGSALEVAMKERVIGGLEVFQEARQIGVGVGHFAFVNSAGEKTLGCREYGKITFKFEAEGIVVNGERPVMEVEGACEFSEDLAHISPLYIPVARIFAEKPADGEFQFRDGKEITVRFSNLSNEWPRQWVLVGTKMSGGHSDFIVNRNDLGKVLGRPFVLNLRDEN